MINNLLFFFRGDLMVYANTAEVMVGVYTKLQNSKEGYQKKIQELSYQLMILKDYRGTELYEKIEDSLSGYQNKLEIAQIQLDIIQKQIDGGASLDGFIKKESNENEAEGEHITY